MPKHTVRLGNVQTGKNRPLKIIMKNAEDKKKIMSRLSKLKNAEASLRSISVRDDHTLEERQLIRNMTEVARQKNEADNATHWKVRGNAKNGWRVVKITARL